MTNPIDELLAKKGILLADGATGTNLFALGLEAGEAPELWNESKPEEIVAFHRGFVDAGSDIILTNSFGGSRHRLKLHGADGRVYEINKIAAELARRATEGSGRRVIVAGSVGPTGELLQPLGALSYDDAVDAFIEQIEGLKAGGAEVAWIETMSAPEEIRAACEAAAKVGLPFTYTGSFDTAGKTMMGLAPKDTNTVASDISEPPVAFGANCGVGPSDILASLLDMSEANPDSTIIVKGNCGIPEYRGAEIHYSGTPELMADYARLAVDAGARIIGGCCGTTYEHIRAMRAALDGHQKSARPDHETIRNRIGDFRNKTADEGGPAPQRERRRRRA
jgi:5-methyltetrahydrofolate--homocysteine methyltransferase